MESGRFDAVTRRLSTTSTRRGVLGVLTGVVSLGLGEVAAKRRQRQRHAATPQDGGNSACAQFCHTLFAPGSDRGQCTSEAAHGQGLCVACGGDARAVCCDKSNGYCRSYATAGCCGGGCTPDCTDKACGASDGCGGTCTACPSGQVCLSETCLATCPGAVSCELGAGGCQPPATCLQTTSGTSVCLDLTTNVPCNTDADCGQRLGIGAVCVVNPPQAPPCQNRSTPFCAICGVPGGCHTSGAS
jgi:hypothetical protein